MCSPAARTALTRDWLLMAPIHACIDAEDELKHSALAWGSLSTGLFDEVVRPLRQAVRWNHDRTPPTPLSGAGGAKSTRLFGVARWGVHPAEVLQKYSGF